MRYDGFEYSGDHQWARWGRGVDCGYCSADWKKVEAIGVSIYVIDDMIEVEPVCATCAKDKNIIMFGHEADMAGNEYGCDRCGVEVPDGEGHYPEGTDDRVCAGCHKEDN